MLKFLVKLFECFSRTISNDCSEFAKHLDIAKHLNAKIYFTDPYSSWQKGSIENMNKLIRQYIPKKYLFQ